MTLDLRPATLDDLDAIMALETAGFAPGIVEERAVFRRRVEAFPEGFLLTGEPAWGYLCAEVWDGEPDESAFHLDHDIGTVLTRTGDTLYIASMTVDPERRGSGLGRLLFRDGVAFLTERFSSVRRVLLIVNEHWYGARGLYRGEGYAETGRLPAFFRPESGPQGDALIMEKRL